MKQDACNIYDCEVRNEMLKQLPQGKTMTQEKIFEIEKNTRDQSSSDQWYDERKKRLTASNFGAVIKRKKSIYPKSLLEKIQNPPRRSNPPTPCKWGMDKEENAIKAYYNFKQQEGKSVRVCSKCGFVVDSTSTWLGASPDFLVSDISEVTKLGVGEVKCPYSKRDMTIKEACQDKTFFLEEKNGKIHLKQNHNYYYQIQGCMAMLHLKWCDFVVFTNKDLYVERIKFESELCDKQILPELNSFYFTYLSSSFSNEQ